MLRLVREFSKAASNATFAWSIDEGSAYRGRTGPGGWKFPQRFSCVCVSSIVNRKFSASHRKAIPPASPDADLDLHEKGVSFALYFSFPNRLFFCQRRPCHPIKKFPAE